MVDISGFHFIYRAKESKQYGLIFANVETSRIKTLRGTVESQAVFNKATKTRTLIDNDYTSFPLSLDVEIITEDGQVIPHSDLREIEKWLFSNYEYSKLYMDTSDDIFGDTYEFIGGDQKNLYLNCRFLNPERLEYNGGIVGYKATLEADSGMWWQDAVTQSFDLNLPASDSTENITVSVDTDFDDYTYPRVTITMGSIGGNVILINQADDSHRLTKFSGLSALSSVVLQGGLNYVSYIDDETLYYDKFDNKNKNFPRLLDGDNTFTVMGNVASISFEFSNRRML